MTSSEDRAATLELAMGMLLAPAEDGLNAMSGALPSELTTLLEAAATGILDYAGCAKTDYELSVTDASRPGYRLVITIQRTSGGAN